jgi:hypothetical protein
MKRRVALKFFAAVAVLAATAGLFEAYTQAMDRRFVQRIGPKETPFGYGVAEHKRWPHRFGEATSIPVCWENPSTDDSAARLLVQQVLKDTWSDAAPIVFTGFEQCAAPPNQKGIRVRIADEGERTLKLGRDLSGLVNGMTLNFLMTKTIPSSWCIEKDDNRKDCIRAIAVHEFGHALGLAHEHNRPDTPGECWEQPQGPKGDVRLTPWDKDSVMNYCHPIYRTGGWTLSDKDKKSIVLMYGERR